ncbi:hypothetical protein J6590_048267 [Homalodisca vitripennis]|nr:hypothetical protein J6590_048267 [Homalodisca vitripennis]
MGDSSDPNLNQPVVIQYALVGFLVVLVLTTRDSHVVQRQGLSSLLVFLWRDIVRNSVRHRQARMRRPGYFIHSPSNVL